MSRLIDADELKKAVEDFPNCYNGWSDTYDKAFIIGAIEEAPTIDTVSVVHGEWIFRREFVEDTPFTGYRCSNCNYWKGMGAWNFCPNCGAHMKGADDDI